jgi:ETC complex I subunit conserved region
MRNYDPNPLRRSSVGSDHPDLIDSTLQHEGEDNCPPRNIAPLAQRAFPPDTMAIIYRPARSAMTSGKANTRRWKLRFEQRAAPFIEPLMGWTGGTDTLSQVELDFPSAEAAIAYARRQGLNFVVQGLAEAPQAHSPMSDNSKPANPSQLAAQVIDRRPCTRTLEWVERALGVRATKDGIDLHRALTNPAAAFGEPERVVRHPQLSLEQKREILRRWALEAYRTDDAMKRETARTDFSRIDKVIDALIDLEEPAGLVIRRQHSPGGGARAA